MPEYEPIDYRLRCHSKRTDLPPDVLRDICEAYETIQRLTKERDEARREVSSLASRNFLDDKAAIRRATELDRCDPKPAMSFKDAYSMNYAEKRGWDCFKNAPVVKTLNGVVVSKGKAVPPKFDLEENDNV